MGVERTLAELLGALQGKATIPPGAEKVVVRGITDDSRGVRPGFLFVAVPGIRQDARAFVDDAVRAGAVAVLTAPPAPDSTAPVVLVPDVRWALARLAASWYDNPSEQLRLVGITGTVGKTSVLAMLDRIMGEDGHPVGTIGSLGIRVPGSERDTDNTTPGSLVLHRSLREMADAGLRTAVMEVTSHALAQQRVADLRFAIGVFTNLIMLEHLEYHRTFADYVAAKIRFFDHLARGTPIVYAAGDRALDALVRSRPLHAIGCGADDGAVVHIGRGEQTAAGTRMQLTVREEIPTTEGGNFGPGRIDVRLPLLGRPNITNAALAAAAALCLGAHQTSVARGLESMRAPRRRMQVVRDAAPLVIDDTVGHPDSITAVMELAEAMPHRRLHVVFAVRGRRGPAINQRDAEALAIWMRRVPIDRLVVTSSEDSADERNRVDSEEEAAFLSCLQRETVQYEHVPRLADAITRGAEGAGEGDIVLLLGAQGMDGGAELMLERFGA